MEYTGIILAAGRGSRLKNLTKSNPKCLLKFKGKTLLEQIINNLKENNITEIYLVSGYKSKKILTKDVKKIHNKMWADSSIFNSLHLCSKILKKKKCIISYSDIYYDKNCIKALKKTKGNISILSNSGWKKLWRKRFNNPLKDLESFKIKKNYLYEIGDKVNKLKEIEGQFMGLFKIKPEGWNKILAHRKNYYNENTKKTDITNFFKSLIQEYKKSIYVKKVDYQWYEIDFYKDYSIARKNIEL